MLGMYTISLTCTRMQLVMSEIISLTLLRNGGMDHLELKGDLAVQVLIDAAKFTF